MFPGISWISTTHTFGGNSGVKESQSISIAKQNQKAAEPRTLQNPQVSLQQTYRENLLSHSLVISWSWSYNPTYNLGNLYKASQGDHT